ncbi:hypothetical protein J1N35_029356 [Gossypium stocksii]|uniref:Uncharacterized protein n=1 Tax=Gossypium stocksii TaxID=47602 RepID=A0A9D3UZX1_9ROSI|nr:hypothetical protein J1N35_029356 [Gossypium stocksii]
MLVERKSRRRSGDSQDSGSMAAGKERLGSRFNVLTVEGKRTDSEKRSTKAYFRGLNVDSVQSDLNSPDSREEDNMKSVSYAHIKVAKKSSLDSDAQKKTHNLGLDSESQKNTINLVTERIGGGVYAGQENEKTRLKSLGKKIMIDCGSNGSLVGPPPKENPNGLCSKLNDIKAHFNSAFKGPMEVEVQLTDNILDHGKHFAVTFKNFSNSLNQSKCRTFEIMSLGNTGNKDQKSNGKHGITRGRRKNSNVLKGFKASTNLRVFLADSMKEVAKLISSNLSNEAEIGVLAKFDPSGLNDSRQ